MRSGSLVGGLVGLWWWVVHLGVGEWRAKDSPIRVEVVRKA